MINLYRSLRIMRNRTRRAPGAASLLPFLIGIAAPFLCEAQDADTMRIASPPIDVVAFRVPLAADSVPFTVARVAPRGDLSGLGLGDALAPVPGLQIDNRHNFALGDRIAVRGFGARTQFGVRGVRVITDGVPATFADGQSALEIVDPGEIDHAEVLSGPASSLYGNAAGGVILLRSRSVAGDPLAIEAGGTVGSDGLARETLHLGGPAGAADYRFDLSNFGYRGYRDYSASHATRLRGEAGYHVGGDSLILRLGYVRFDAENPGSLTRQLADANPRQAYVGSVQQRTGKEGNQGVVAGDWSHRMGEGRLRLDGYLIRRDVHNPIAGKIIDLHRTAGGGTALVEGRFAAGSVSVAWSAGADIDFMLDDRKNFLNSRGNSGALLLDQREGVTGVGAFLQAIIAPLPALRLMGGIRYDHTRFAVTDRFITPDDPDDSGERPMRAFSPSAGLLWMLLDALHLYANIATAFETPTTTELANRPNGAGGFNGDLQQQRALSMEAGIAGSPLKGLSYRLALYTVAITGELIPYQVPSAPDRDFFRNAGSTRHRGLEGSIGWSPLSGLTIDAGCTLMEAVFREYDIEGKRLDGNAVPGIAPGRLHLEMAWTSSGGYFIGAGLHHLSAMPVDDANSASTEAYSLLDLRAGSRGIPIPLGGSGAWRLGLRPTIGVTNLLDSRYTSSVTINAAGGRYYEPGPGRSFYLGLAIGLEKTRRE